MYGEIEKDKCEADLKCVHQAQQTLLSSARRDVERLESELANKETDNQKVLRTPRNVYP